MMCSDLRDCFCWSSIGIDFHDAVFELLCLQCLKFQFMLCFVSYLGVFAPVFTCAGDVTTSFVGHECVFSVFTLFVGV